MMVALTESYRYCARVSRTQAANFYYSFLVLPPPKRAAMCAVYAFFRFCDDLSDSGESPGSRQGLLAAWRGALDDALRGHCAASPILPAFHDTVQRYAIPGDYFHSLIDGAEMDLTTRRYATFQDLYLYCYRVASIVGLVCTHIFGFSDPAALRHAEECGIAFQLTNILRDLKEDAVMDRIYLPQEDLARFSYTEADLKAGCVDDRFLALMRFETDRARSYYRGATALLPLIDPDSRPALNAMMRIYGGLLQEIERQRYDVFSRRISLSGLRKVGIAGKAWLSPERRPPVAR